MKNKGIHIIQIKVKDTITLKTKINKEIKKIYDICHTILYNIEKYKNNNIISINDYFDNVKQINTLIDYINDVKHQITFKNILKFGIFKYIKIISEYKLLLVILIEKYGCLILTNY